MKKIIAFIRSTLFYLISIPSILGGGIILMPLIVLMPQKARWFCLTNLLNLIILQVKYICGVNYTVDGLNNFPATPYVALSKHQSPWETFFLFITLSPVSMVMKRSLLKMPAFGWGIAMTKPIPIDRDQPKQAIKQLLSAGVSRLNDDKQAVLIFPEGTRLAHGTSKKFAAGGALLAKQANVPVVFIAHNAGKFWPSGKFIKWPGTIEVVISKPVDSSVYSAKEMTTMAQNWVEMQMERLA